MDFCYSFIIKYVAFHTQCTGFTFQETLEGKVYKQRSW